jgi:tRNA threonylcarbamoyladenosine biosynthesis protein TsaB
MTEARLPSADVTADPLVLAFDTATAAVTVAVCSASGVVASATTVDRRRHAELLAPSIRTVLTEAGVAMSRLTSIAVGVGPGPYTGLRVGVVTARALGDALGVPVHGVCTLDAIAWGSELDGPFVAAIDARRKEVYWATYDDPRRRRGGPHVGPPGDAAAAKLPAIGEGALLYPEISAGERGAPTLPDAGTLGMLALARPAASLTPTPLYLRRPDAREPGPRKPVIPSLGST